LARFPVEDGESIDLYCAIEYRLFHCFALSLGIHTQGAGDYDGEGRQSPMDRCRGMHSVTSAGLHARCPLSLLCDFEG